MVQKNYKKRKSILRDDIGQYTSEKKENKIWKIKLLIFVLFVLALGGLIANIILKVNAWSEKHEIKTQSPVTFNKPIWVEDRKPLIVLSPFVEKVEGIEVETTLEKKICNKWGDKYCLLAISIFRCESGLRVDAVNWSSKDIGLAQINWPTWEAKVKEKFNYTLKDMFVEDKNLEVAYWIWDRADGVDGDGNGSFKAWTVFNNGTFVSCVE
jgi:hypothetical protein